MNTTWRVTDTNGQLLGTFNDVAAVKPVVAANPGARVESVVTITNPCAAHPAYEADYCPACGTARVI